MNVNKKWILRAIPIGLTLAFILSLTAMATPYQSNTGQPYTSGQSQQNQNNNQNQNQQSNNGTGNGYGSAASYMIGQGYMKGDGSGNYNLSGYITRGDMMIMIVRAFNLNSNAGGNHYGNFKDVDESDYYYDAVMTARSLDIANGDGTNFMPGNYVTIEQAILFIERTAEKAGTELSIDLRTLYDDSDITQYATREDICELLYYALTENTDGFGGDYGHSNGWGNGQGSNGWNYTGSMSVIYSVDDDDTLTLDGDDFIDACDDATGEDLDYVIFTSLPSSSYGVLYTDDDCDTKVTKSTAYDADDLSDMTFVPNDGYSGTVTYTYTGYTDDDTTYTGTVKIAVSDESIVADTISYETYENTELSFDGGDFSDACDDATGEDPDYVIFTSLPSSSYGILYTDDECDTKVTKSTAYDTDDLSDMTFVPADDYNGTAQYTYTGYTDDGSEYTGTLKIKIVDIVASTVLYTADENEAITFDGEDFSDALTDIVDKTLSYVKFTSLSSSSKGVLYYDYDEDDSTYTKVSTSKSYDEDQLSVITFVPADDYSGTVSLKYTGYATDGTAYTGNVSITVG
jgi:hypothetical protein